MRKEYQDIKEGLTNYVYLGTAIFLILVILFILFLAISVQRRKRMEKERELLQSQFQQELLQTQLEIQEQTLKTISEEIHDNVGQVLSLAKLNLNTLEYGETQKIQDTKNLVAKAINDLRNLSRSLHGDRVAELGLQQSVADELQLLQNTGQFTTRLTVTGTACKLENRHEMVLFRIVQETLNNAVKHSGAKNIQAQLQYMDNELLITINDDGVGFDAGAMQQAAAGIGLKSMQNRAALIGAVCTVQAQPGNGTTVTITLPYSTIIQS